MGLLQIWISAALLAFVVGCAYKAIRFATMPVHLRWELYPVAHDRERAEHGGSYFEDADWWTKPRRRSLLGEAKTIAQEVLALRIVRENNRGLWLPSLAFHWGLYLLCALGCFLIAGAVGRAPSHRAIAWLAGGRLLSAWGAIGLALASVGCGALLARRLVRRDLRGASTPAGFFHLALLLAVFAASWASWLAADRDYTLTARFLRASVTLTPAAPASPWLVAEVVLLGLFLAYLPWSQMTHFFTKFFTWHSVRWDDAPNLGGSVYEERMRRSLLRPVHWSAPHVGADGARTWADVTRGRGGA